MAKPGKKISGGDVFIIILFVVGFVYFAGGMLINYQRTGGTSGGGVCLYQLLYIVTTLKTVLV